jgi:hypothetical protein
MVKKIIDPKGETKDSAVSFIILGDYMKLKIDVDITLLDCNEGHLSTYAMDFLRLWFKHKCLSFCDLYITHPHMWEIVKNYKKEKGEYEHSVT